jgi:hypothetical protein
MTWLLRLFGLLLAIGAAGWLAWLGYALYTPNQYGLTALVQLGMPAAMFGALVAGVSVGAGLWLAGRGSR